PADVPAIARVRTSVRENLLTMEQLAERGITNESIAASLAADRRGWVAVRDGEIVGFSMADRSDHSIFALFVLPGHEDRGIGGRLLDLAMQCLWESGADVVWLTTAAGTKAARFYEKRGWVPAGRGSHGDVRYECRVSPDVAKTRPNQRVTRPAE